MYRSKILGGMALASLMLVILTGCPSMIANIVGTSESVQQAVNSASAGDTIKVQGSHDEDVTIDQDNITITGQNGATIDGKVTVDGNNVTIENVTITGVLDTVPGSFQNLTLSNVTVGGWNNANVSGTFSCTRVVQPGGDLKDTVENQASAGDNVCVAPATYTIPSTLIVNKSLTLRGFAQPVIEADLSAMGTPSFTENGTTHNAENRQIAVWVHDADGVTINNFVIRDTSPNTSPPPAPRGIFVSVDSNTTNGSSDNFTLQNSVIEDLVSSNNRARGLAFNVAEDTTKGQQGSGASLDTANNFVLNNNTFRDIQGDGSGADIANAIYLQGDIQGARITGNTITNLTSTGSCTQGIDLIEDSGNPVVGPTNFTLEDNTFSNFSGSATCFGRPTVTDFAVFLGQYLDLGTNHTVANNNFNSGAIDRCSGCGNDSNPNYDVLDAQNNWWGDASGPSTSANATDPAKDPNSGAKANGSGVPIVKAQGADAQVRFDSWADSPF